MRYDRVYNFSAGPAMMPESVLEEIAAETAGTALGQKLTDLQLIYEAFQALVELRFHDPLDELALALGRATEKNWFAGRHIWVDSFDYFSVSERALLEHPLHDLPRPGCRGGHLPLPEKISPAYACVRGRARVNVRGAPHSHRR